MNFIMSILIFLSVFFSFEGQANSAQNPNFFCGKYLGSLPIQQRGRTKPLYVHAKEVMKFLTGKTTFNGLDAVTNYCLLNVKGMEIPVTISLATPIEHVDLKKILDFKEKQKTITFEELQDYKQELRIASVKNSDETSLGKAVKKTIQKLNLYEAVVSGSNWLLPETTVDLKGNKLISWIPVSSFLTEDKIIELKSSSSDPFKELFLQAQRRYIEIEGDLHLTELKFSKLKLPIINLILCLFTLIFLMASPKKMFWKILCGVLVSGQITYVIFRVMISGRAPITNMYETVMFSGFAALLLGLFIGYYKKDKTPALLGLVYNALTLMMQNFSGSMLSPQISPLVPVLRDNFWLSTHVTTVIISYGAYALSWVLANIVLIKSRFFTISKEEIKHSIELIYSCLKYGSILLAAGLLLGGVWADFSWGRFWGWDPKETWSLIVLCLYMAILHGRYTSWISNGLFIPLVALAFLSVMMAWFGVNYILATGLHSYGFSEGGAIFLGSFFLIQIVIVAITFNGSKTRLIASN
ncbi:MAG: cytochrome c biogenesis protein [Bacteriovoracaceae bacterium]